MKSSVISILWVACFAANVNAQLLQGEAREKGIAGCTANCNKAQTGSALNQTFGLTALQINTYCRCYCTQMVNRLTAQEFANLARTGVLSDFAKSQIAEASPLCIERVRQITR